MKKWVIGCGIAALIVVLVLTIIGHVANNPGRMVRAELARIKAEGAPLTMKDLDGVRIPDELNGAVVYQKAFKLISGKDAKKDMELIKRACSPSDPIKTKAEWENLRRVIAKYDGVVPIVEEAIAKPDCRFWIDWENGGPLAEFPHMPRLRDIERILVAKAALSTRDGKTNTAAHYIELGFAIDFSLKYRPCAIAFLVRCSMIQLSSNALRDTLAHCDISGDDARLILERLSRIDLAGDYNEVLMDERALMLWAMEKIREDPSYFDCLSGSPTGAHSPVPQGPLWNSWRDLDELFLLKTMRLYIQNSKSTYREVASKHIYDQSSWPKYAVASSKLLSVYLSCIKRRDSAQAEINGSRIAIALSVYHNQHKAYPTSLKSVADILGGKLPIDPFSGRDYVYTRKCNGYLLYSIGQNLKDDAGWERGPKDDMDAGDIVWRMK